MTAVAELAAHAPSGRSARDHADPATALPQLPDDQAPDDDDLVAGGRLVAVWGPTGAPGRTTIAVNVAVELAELGETVLLADADTYGGVVAQSLGVLDEAPGLAAACRPGQRRDPRRRGAATARARAAARAARPHRHRARRPLAGAPASRARRGAAPRPAARLGHGRRLRLLPGAGRGARVRHRCATPERGHAGRARGGRRPSLGVARRRPGRAAALRSGACRSSPRSVPGLVPLTVVNRLRKGVVGPGDPRREIAAALERYAGVAAMHVIPDDQAALDAALAAGRSLAEAAPSSPARKAMRDLAASLVGRRSPACPPPLRRPTLTHATPCVRLALECSGRAPGGLPSGRGPRRGRRRAAACGRRRTSRPAGSRR